MEFLPCDMVNVDGLDAVTQSIATVMIFWFWSELPFSWRNYKKNGPVSQWNNDRSIGWYGVAMIMVGMCPGTQPIGRAIRLSTVSFVTMTFSGRSR